MFVNGSPRRYGFTKKLLLAASRGAMDEGCISEVIDLYDYKIKPCIGCVSDGVKLCRFPCIVKDDFNRIGEKLVEASGIVVGTPIYWYGVSGVLKNLIDRMTSLENMIHHVGHSLVDGKVAGFIAVGNDTGAIQVIAYLMSVFNSMGYHIPAWALAYHHSLDDVLENDAAVLDAYNIGVNVCRASKMLKTEKHWYTADVDIEKIVDSIKEEVREKSEKESEERKKLFSGDSI